MEVSFVLPTQEIIGYGLAVIMFLAWAYAVGMGYRTRTQIARLNDRLDLHADVMQEYARQLADMQKPTKKKAAPKRAQKKPPAQPAKAVPPAKAEPPTGMGSALSDRLGSVMRESSLDIHDVIPAEDL